jgi:hypothetical protein
LQIKADEGTTNMQGNVENPEAERFTEGYALFQISLVEFNM